ncbi:BrnA antitoxin family protein [Herbaspirillum sp. SJZ107]|uniref:BrnA antitoxin family protein n=1 Tax=Herbaspirillum sp. SJZ107 TaxID=2572881 RepID=UPI001154561E|nr:BrnA antitoxin family protein [Herbaspirillum sp. SJZ107]TQK05413.1 BrnA antitoxin of type II toxin-antitoxin system [Herbaspirillum sp. SJZ107]
MNSNVDLPTAPRRRTRPPKRKTRITIYLDDEVLDEFRSRAERTGTGYQTLINAALRGRLEGAPAAA